MRLKAIPITTARDNGGIPRSRPGALPLRQAAPDLLLQVPADAVVLQVETGEVARPRRVRFRTLGCYPLSGAIESDATDVPGILKEMRRSRRSERQGRLIDHDEDASMETKKREGYF